MSKYTYERRKEAGLCVMCGGTRDILNNIKCSKCINRNSNRTRETREKRKEQGICVTCGINSAGEKSLDCEECREKRNQVSRYKYNELKQDPERYKEYRQKAKENKSDKNMKYYYHKRKEEGLCPTCGRGGVIEGRAFCQSCIDKSNQRQEERKRQGLCINCKNNKAIDGLTICQSCSDKYKERYKELVSLGICTNCRKEKATHGLYCKECSDKKKNYHSNLYWERKEEDGEAYQKIRDDWQRYSKQKIDKAKSENLCINCLKNTPVEGMTICQDCRDENKKIYDWYKEKGICVKCHQREAEEGKISCTQCLDSNVKNSAAKWERIKNNPERHIKFKESLKNRNYNRSKYREDNNLCQRCGKSLSEFDIYNKYKSCISCRTHHNFLCRKRRGAIPRDTRHILNLCYKCSKPVKEGLTLNNEPFRICEECYQTILKMNKIRKGEKL